MARLLRTLAIVWAVLVVASVVLSIIVVRNEAGAVVLLGSLNPFDGPSILNPLVLLIPSVAILVLVKRRP